MKKYFHIFKTGFKENAQTYVNMILGVISFCTIIYIFVQLWAYIYTNGQPILHGYTLQNMLWYLIAAEVIAYSARGRYLIRGMGNDVKSGKIVYQLSKPYNYYLYSIVTNFSETVFKLLFLLPVGFLLGYLLIGAIPAFSIAYLLPIMLSIVLSGLVVASSYGVIGLLVFWIEDAEPFSWIYDKMLMLFGIFFPPEFFPSFLQGFVSYSPIYAVYSGPSKLMAQFSWQLFASTMMVQVFYIVFFITFGLVLYSKAARKVNLHGG